jgi:hypothetical protein
MRLIATGVLATALGSMALAAQGSPNAANPVSDAARQLLARDSKNLVASAELLPAEKYAYRPPPAQMTFGHLIMHVAQSNVALCAAISGMPPAPLGTLAETDAKDTLVTAIKQSFDYCTQGLAKVTDAQLGDEVTVFGTRKVTRGSALLTIATDWADHYSTAAAYLRLNGFLPPTAPPGK